MREQHHHEDGKEDTGGSDDRSGEAGDQIPTKTAVMTTGPVLSCPSPPHPGTRAREQPNQDDALLEERDDREARSM